MTDQELAQLHAKLDALSEQIALQNQRQQQLVDLKDDMMPIVDHMVRLTILELDEIGKDFELEDLLYLFKRILRSTRRLNDLLDLVDAGIDLAEEVQLHGREMMSTGIDALSRLEQKGYFNALASGMRILDRIVQEFSQEELQAIEENTDHLVSALRALTKTETLASAGRALEALSEPAPEDPPSLLGLLRRTASPEVRIVLAKLLDAAGALTSPAATASS